MAVPPPANQRYQRSGFLVLAFLLFVSGSLSAADPTPSGNAAARPNIIFILTDDQGYGDLSCHGHPILKTPNLDRLHRESVRFTDFQVSPLCSPSRCAFMTGRHEYRAGVYGTRPPACNMSLDATTIAQVLQSAGYATGIFGKWHLGEGPAYIPTARGFDEALVFPAGMIAERERSNARRINPILLRNGVKEKTTGYDTDVYFGEAIKWIAKVKGSRPFFAYIATGAPHNPQQCPDSFAQPYADKAGNAEMARYYGIISNIDENAGRLLAQLKAWDLEGNTLVVFSNDNGATKKFKGDLSPAHVFNAGMTGAKGSVREGGTRVSSFWRWPDGFAGGRDVAQLASNTDFFPTVAELAGAKIPGNLALDGRSLVPLLKDPQAAWPDRLVFIHDSNWGGKAADHKSGWAVRSNQYRLINGNALYDIKADRGETKDVSGEHPEEVARMRAAYDKWWTEVLRDLEKAQESNPPRKPEKGLKDEPAED